MTSGRPKPRAPTPRLRPIDGQPVPAPRHRALWLPLLLLGTGLSPVRAGVPPGAVPATAAAVPLSLPSLFSQLAARSESRVRFVESKQLTLLERPLRLEGIMEFRRPAYLAKHVKQPAVEDYVIDGALVTVTRAGESAPLMLSLTDVPLLAAFAESLRAPLAGDLPALQRHWRPSLGGSRRRWLLALVPAAPDLAKVVRSVRLEGEADRVTRMVIEETNGDRSTLEFEALP